MRYEDMKHLGRYNWNYNGKHRVVIHHRNVSVPYQRDPTGDEIISVWVQGYYPDAPERGTFVYIANLTPYEEKNEFGPVSP